jgi:hypothetical protein
MKNPTTHPCKFLNKTLLYRRLTVDRINRPVRQVEIATIAYTAAQM